ncbi:MAG: hypothetical protein GVY28_07655 [Alphaproteobacteria bacterium]|nr:hypothetical protein [Alphaproteobacteria bacterium]
MQAQVLGAEVVAVERRGAARFNKANAPAVTAEAFASLTNMPPVFERGDQVFVSGDYALHGDPADAPVLP